MRSLMRHTCVHSGDNLGFSPRWTEMDDDDNCTLVYVRPRVHSLPEIGPLPRASVFAESQMSCSRQRKVCRESALGNGRPSAKPYLPRARPSAKNSSRQPGPLPRVRPSAKKGRRQPVTAGKRPSPAVCFAEGQNLALGKELLCRVSFLCPRQNIFFLLFLLPNFFPGFTVVP